MSREIRGETSSAAGQGTGGIAVRVPAGTQSPASAEGSEGRTVAQVAFAGSRDARGKTSTGAGQGTGAVAIPAAAGGRAAAKIGARGNAMAIGTASACWVTGETAHTTGAAVA